MAMPPTWRSIMRNRCLLWAVDHPWTAAWVGAFCMSCGPSDASLAGRTGSAGQQSSTGSTTGVTGGAGGMSDSDSGGGAGSGGATDPGLGGPYPIDGSACGAIIEQHPIETSNHVPECSAISYGSNP